MPTILKKQNTYYKLLILYVLASVSSQFLTSTPIHLFTISDVPIWLPLSAITLVPLVDVLRSFTQAAGEASQRDDITICFQMLGISLLTSAACVSWLGLPAPIFIGVLLAVTIGGAIDLTVFKHMRRWFSSPVKRMAFSNAAATLTGSGIVFFVAFTDLLFAGNELAKPLDHVVVGWLTQSLFVWLSSLVIASGLGKLKR